jgi:hypothetical protein
MAITRRQKNSKTKCRVKKHEREQIFCPRPVWSLDEVIASLA